MSKINKNSYPLKKITTTSFLLATLLFFLTGCFGGYATFSQREQVTFVSSTKLEQISVLLVRPDPKTLYYWELKCSDELYFSLARTLRSKYNVVDMNSNAQNRITIIAEHYPRNPITHRLHLNEGLWSFIHGVSFGMVPMIWNEKHSIVFNLTLPTKKDNKKFSYDYSIRYYSWLPFLLLDPGFIFSEGWEDNYSEKRIELYDEITTRFIQEATPLILSQTDEQLSSKQSRTTYE